MQAQKVFVQIGATRDGLDPYLSAAHNRAMAACLIESPDYLLCRQLLRRQDFDLTIPVPTPSDPAGILEALEANGIEPVLVLPGFEQYTQSAFVVALRLGVLQANGASSPFLVLDKAEQRRKLSKAAPWIKQPWHLELSLYESHDLELLNSHLPLVIKPVNSAGGWGVGMATTVSETHEILRALRELRNYDGSQFERVILEEFVDGEEASVQGICYSGQVQILSYCHKVIGNDNRSNNLQFSGFSELAHIVMSGEETPPEIICFAIDCLNAMGYQHGPFHIDLKESAQGPVFLEMGFRLSGGGLAKTIKHVTGLNWGEEVFAALLRETPATLRPINSNQTCRAHVVATSLAQVEVARTLQSKGHDVEVQLCDPNQSLVSLSSQQYPALAADLSRHRSRLAYIDVGAQRIDDVRTLVHQIISGNGKLVDGV